MEDPGFSIWIIVILVAFMFVAMWGALFFALSFGTWVIAKTRLREEDPRRSRDDRDYRL